MRDDLIQMHKLDANVFPPSVRLGGVILGVLVMAFIFADAIGVTA